jgi:hypothetical protein
VSFPMGAGGPLTGRRDQSTLVTAPPHFLMAEAYTPVRVGVLAGTRIYERMDAHASARMPTARVPTDTRRLTYRSKVADLQVQAAHAELVEAHVVCELVAHGARHLPAQ